MGQGWPWTSASSVESRFVPRGSRRGEPKPTACGRPRRRAAIATASGRLRCMRDGRHHVMKIQRPSVAAGTTKSAVAQESNGSPVFQ